MGECTISVAECGRTSLLKGQEQEKIWQDAAREKQQGIQGQWQQESPFREVAGTIQKKSGCRRWPPNDASWLPRCEEL